MGAPRRREERGRKGRKGNSERRREGGREEEHGEREREREGSEVPRYMFSFALSIVGVVYDGRERERERERIRRALGISRTKAFYTITRTSSYKR